MKRKKRAAKQRANYDPILAKHTRVDVPEAMPAIKLVRLPPKYRQQLPLRSSFRKLGGVSYFKVSPHMH